METIKVELGLSNNATKSDLKNVTVVDTSDFAKKADIRSWKSDDDKLDFDELEKVPSGLNSLKSKVDNLDIDKLEIVANDLL